MFRVRLRAASFRISRSSLLRSGHASVINFSSSFLSLKSSEVTTAPSCLSSSSCFSSSSSSSSSSSILACHRAHNCSFPYSTSVVRRNLLNLSRCFATTSQSQQDGNDDDNNDGNGDNSDGNDDNADNDDNDDNDDDDDEEELKDGRWRQIYGSPPLEATVLKLRRFSYASATLTLIGAPFLVISFPETSLMARLAISFTACSFCTFAAFGASWFVQPYVTSIWIDHQAEQVWTGDEDVTDIEEGEDGLKYLSAQHLNTPLLIETLSSYGKKTTEEMLVKDSTFFCERPFASFKSSKTGTHFLIHNDIATHPVYRALVPPPQPEDDDDDNDPDGEDGDHRVSSK